MTKQIYADEGITRDTPKAPMLGYVFLFLMMLLISGFGIESTLGGTAVLAAVISISFVAFIFSKSSTINVKLMLIMLLLLSCIVITTAFVGDEIKQLLIFAIYTFSSILFVQAYKERLIIMLPKLMYFLAIWSLVLWVLYAIAPSVVEMLPTLKNANDIEAHTILFSTIYPAGNMSIARNQGIFWEPGAYQTFLNLALMITLFYDGFKGCRARYSTIFIITLLTTFSTTAYITAVAILTIYFIKEFAETKDAKKLFKVILAAAIVGLVLFAIYNQLPESAKYQLFGKVEDYVESGGNELSSTQNRIEAIKIAFNEFLSSPIFGVGVARMDEASEYIKGNVTCTPLNWFAFYGAIVGIVMNMGLYRLTKVFTDKKVLRIFLFICILLTIISENYYRNPLILIFVFLGFICSKESLEKLNENSTN